MFVELPEVGAEVTVGASFGEIESTKSVSDVYVPLSGKVVEVNTDLDDGPERLNEDPYGEGVDLCGRDHRCGSGRQPPRRRCVPGADRGLIPSTADVFCNKCGHGNPLGSNFCSSCGAPLSGDPVEPTTLTFQIEEHAADGDADLDIDHFDTRGWLPSGKAWRALFTKRH